MVTERALGSTHPEVLRQQSDLAHSLRLAGHPELAEPYARVCAEQSAVVLGATHPLTSHRRNNLALTLLMLRRAPAADRLLAESWRAMEQRYAIVAPATAFHALISAGLQRREPADPIGRLKALLTGPALLRADGVADKWDVGYFIDYQRDALPADCGDFLVALLAAINDPARASDLGRFPLWRDAPALPLETPWPEHDQS
jgi:hypothetical protein